MHIVLDDLSGAATRDLLTFHHQQMHAASPPGTAFALDLSGLQQPGIAVWTLRGDDTVLGIGALKALRARRVVRSVRAWVRAALAASRRSAAAALRWSSRKRSLPPTSESVRVVSVWRARVSAWARSRACR